MTQPGPLSPARLVVRLPNWIGDIVMSTPALRALRTRFADAHIAVAGPAHAEPILEGLDSVDEVIALPSRKADGNSALRRGAARLRAGKFELAVLLTNSWSSAFVMRLAGIPRRAGYAENGRGLLLTDSLAHPPEAGRHRMPMPMVEYYFRLLESIGVPRVDHHMELAVSDEDVASAAAWLARQGLDGDDVPRHAIHAGSSFGPSKLWYPEHFASVADALFERRGAPTILFCGPQERPLVDAIEAACRHPVASAATDTIDLRTLKAVVKRLDLLITTDTGPRHFGPAFDVPTVCLMGSTDPRFTNTNLHGTAVVRSGVDCSPCQLKVCPIDHRCMTRLTPEMVLAAVARVTP